MKSPPSSRPNWFARLVLALCAAWFCLVPGARAGLNLELQPTLYNYGGNYYYYTGFNLNTNSTGGSIPFGDYYLQTSALFAGSGLLYRYDTNGFNYADGGYSAFNDFDSFKQNLTNGVWYLYYTNAAHTSNTLYHFVVTSTLTSNQFGQVVITYPPDGSVNITNQPVFTWTGGPPAVNQETAYLSENSGNNSYGNFLTPSQRSLPSPYVLLDGTNNFTVHMQVTNAGVLAISVPTNAAGQSIPGWTYDSILDSYNAETFTVNTLDTSGTGHTLVAHYPFDGTTGFGGVSGADTSGNGYNLNFGGSFGSQGGVSSTTTAVAGGRALQLHDGDNNSAGYIGWNTTPPALLSAFSGSFSMSCWIQTSQNYGYDNIPAYQGAGIVTADNSGLQNDVIPLALSGSKAAFSTGGDEDLDLVSTTSINDGGYHHIVVTRNQVTGQKALYVDGALDNWNSGSTNILSDPQKITIGALMDASDPNPNDLNYYNGFAGLLDDLQIYTGVLSSIEVSNLFNNPGVTAPNFSGGVPLGTAVNAPSLTWTTSGDSAWFGQSTTSHDGVSAAQSGVVINNQSSTMQTTVTGPGTLSFWWQTAANDFNFDLEFDIDGGYYDDIGGNTSWTQDTFTVSPGSHTLTWTVTANSSTDPTDTGWVDQFVFTPGQAVAITANPFNQTNYPGYTVALYAQASGSGPLSWQWYKVGPGLIPNATNALYIPTNSGTAGVAGSYYAVANNTFSFATSSSATVTFVSNSLPPDWSVAFKTPFNNNNTPMADYILAIIPDASGNVYSAGQISGTNTIGGTTYSSPNGTYSADIVKQSSTGAPLWTVMVTNNGLGNSSFRCAAPAPGNGIYVAANFTGTNYIGTNKVAESAGGSILLARYDSTGSNMWFKIITGTNFSFTSYFCVVADPSGNVTLSGLAYNTTSFGTTNVTANGQQGFLAQYDSTGTLKTVQLTPYWMDFITYVNGRIYATWGNGATNFTYGAINTTTDRAKSLLALNATNLQPIWIQGIGAPYGVGNPLGLVDDIPLVGVAGSNVFIAGTSFGSNAAFGPYSVNFGQVGGQYFARCDTNGNPQLLTQFGSPTVILWGMATDAAGDSYLMCDFDEYVTFGNYVLGAPHLDSIGNGYYSASFMAKFDKNGNPLWARPASTAAAGAGLVNLRGIALAPDGIWANGVIENVAAFGTHQVGSSLTCIGSPSCTTVYQFSGVVAKITDAALALPVTLFGMTQSGTNFQFSFNSQAGHTHYVLSRTNLALGNWVTNSTILGDGTTKLVVVPDRGNGTNIMFFKVGTQ